MEQHLNKVYRPYFDNAFAAIIFFLIGVLIVSNYLRGGTAMNVLLGGGLYLVVVVAIMVLPLFSFVRINSSTMELTYKGIVKRRVVSIADIVEVSDQPAYIVFAKALRFLDIAYKRGSTVGHIRLRLTLYKPEKIKDLIHELKTLNPRIVVTKH